MQAEKQQSWKIYVHAKAKNFHFKLKVRATNIVPTWEFHQCSIVLKLGKCLLKLKSNNGTALIPSQQQPKTLKSKFLALLKKFRFRRSKNRTIGFKQKPDLSNPKENRMRWFAYKVQYMAFFLQLGIINFTCCSGKEIPCLIFPCFLYCSGKKKKVFPFELMDLVLCIYL